MSKIVAWEALSARARGVALEISPNFAKFRAVGSRGARLRRTHITTHRGSGMAQHTQSHIIYWDDMVPLLGGSTWRSMATHLIVTPLSAPLSPKCESLKSFEV